MNRPSRAELAELESPLRILLVCGSMPPMRCGVGDYTAHLATALADAGHAVAVLTSTAAAATATPFATLPRVEAWTSRAIAESRRTVRDLAPHVVHVQYPSSGYGRHLAPSWLPAALRRSAPVVLQTWHDVPSRRGRLRYLPNALTRDTVVTVLPSFPERLPLWFRVCASRKSWAHVPLAANIPAVQLAAGERLRLRLQLAPRQQLLVAFFGFAGARKGIELLFAACDPRRHTLLLLCELDPGDPYQQRIRRRLHTPPWQGHARAAGYLPSAEVATALAAADVVVLPFVDGVDERNGTWLAARAQGTLVFTTHGTRRGYDAGLHTCFFPPGDARTLAEALDALRPCEVPRGAVEPPDWATVAERHLRLYRAALGRRVPAGSDGSPASSTECIEG